MILTQTKQIHAQLLNCCWKALKRFCEFPLLSAALASWEPGQDLHLLAIGKDAGRMCEAAIKVLKDKVSDGFVLTKYGHYRCPDDRILHLEAGHPIPDDNSLQGSRLIVEWMSGLGRDSELIVLLSGGGSALFEMLNDGMDQAGLTSLNRALLRSSLGIAAVNLERAKYSRLKAGGALTFFKGKQLNVFALSDVEHDDPAVIASGPFTPVHKDERGEYMIIGNNMSFRTILAEELSVLGCDIENDPSYLSEDHGRFIGMIGNELNRVSERDRITIWGGEMPIRFTDSGKGGRCTHLALSVATLLASHPGAVFIALATDGSDNLSGSAGAWVDAQTMKQLKTLEWDVEEILAQADSHTALQRLGQIIATGQFHANVNDVFILYYTPINCLSWG